MEKKLSITFHGRVIEHLGIEMYHSPVAALAELVSNGWDAEADAVNINLPGSLRPDAVIEVSDDGDGMTFEECQGRFLKVGYNRRKRTGIDKTRTGRPVMGRKGIGKFAGFGIAQVLQISTVSRENGEKTVFELDVRSLLGDPDSEEYVDDSPMDVNVVEYLPPDEGRAASSHGTVVTLKNLTIGKTPNVEAFAQSMARRFMLLERAAGFKITINGAAYEVAGDSDKIEFEFPSSYDDGQLPPGVVVEAGWAQETVGGHSIRWRIAFYKDTIGEEDLAGIAVFSHGKLAQRPFLFQLRGGLGGQQGLAYLTGSVVADFIDDFEEDLISTERQRINWEHAHAAPLLEWGQRRTQELLRIWQSKRSEAKVEAVEGKIAGFSGRLEKLSKSEQKVVKRALYAIARISVLSQAQFEDLADAILTAWEGGRLHDLIRDMADADDLDADQLVQLLAESRVMTALHAAERVKSQLNLILSLEERIASRDLENAVRDYLAENPWMIQPRWETFKVEIGVNHLVAEAATEAGITGDDDWNARVDLVLSSGSQLIILEFMRPGLTADWGHVDRFERYVRVLREKVQANVHRFSTVSGLLVADHLERKPGFISRLENLRRDDMDATDWVTLLSDARAQWIDYFDILKDRVAGDDRMATLEAAERVVVLPPGSEEDEAC